MVSHGAMDDTIVEESNSKESCDIADTEFSGSNHADVGGVANNDHGCKMKNAVRSIKRVDFKLILRSQFSVLIKC